MSDFKTADLLDEYYAEHAIQICRPLLQHFGGKSRFTGKVRTIRCFEDNSKVREAVSTPSDGDVLVIDGAGSANCALLGDMLAAKAVDNGWSGIVIHGHIRDSVDIGEMNLGVMALGTMPLKSEKQNRGERDVEVGFAGVRFTPGHFLYADEDGIILSPAKLAY